MNIPAHRSPLNVTNENTHAYTHKAPTHPHTHTHSCLCTHKHTHPAQEHIPRHRSLLDHTRVSTYLHTECAHSYINTNVLGLLTPKCILPERFWPKPSHFGLPPSLPFPGSGKLCGRRGAAASSWTSELPEAQLPGGQPLGPAYTCEGPGDPLRGHTGGPQA